MDDLATQKNQQRELQRIKRAQQQQQEAALDEEQKRGQVVRRQQVNDLRNLDIRQQGVQSDPVLEQLRQLDPKNPGGESREQRKIESLKKKKEAIDKDNKSDKDTERIDRINQRIERLKKRHLRKRVLGVLRNGKQVGLIGNILFFLLMAYAIPIDLLPFVSGGLSTMLDWILDITFFIAVFFVLFITTGDLLGSLIGRKSMINILQTIAEFIPIIDALPFHILAVVLLYLDIKYGIMKLAKGYSSSSTSPS